jgi:hypothetical protein
MSENQEPKIWDAVKAFIGHAVAGGIIFVVLALLAFGLGKFVHFLEVNGASEPLVICLTALEYLLLAVDVAGMLIFLVNALRAALKELSR